MDPARHARLYLTYLRQFVTVMCLGAYAALWAFDSHPGHSQRMVILFAGATLLGVPYLLMVRRFSVQRVVAISTLIDAVVIAVLVWGTGVPHMLSVAFLWPVALASYFLAARLAATAIAASVALWVATLVAADVHLSATTLVPNILAIASVGTLLAYLGASLTTTQRQADRQRDCDAAVLNLSAGIAHEAVGRAAFKTFTRELGEALDADRCILRIFDDAEFGERVVEWHRADMEPQGTAPLPAEALANAMAGRIVSAGDTRELNTALRKHSDGLAIRSGIGVPIIWDGRTVALLSLQQREPRDWMGEVKELLERVTPTVAAVLQRHRLILTQRVALENTREIADLRERLVATTSHELRTPLTVVLGYFDTVSANDPRISQEAIQALYKAAHTSAHKLERIVEDLLLLNRMRSASPPLSLQRSSLQDLLEAIASYSKDEPLAVDYIDPAKPHREVVMDTDRLAQALGNLVENARRHGGGEVGVGIHQRGDWIEIAVTDGGTGVPAEHAEEIFLPFLRFSTHGDSTGIGLSVSRAIVEAHGGTLRYRRATDRERHAFVIAIPLRRASAQGVPTLS
jgi:K+-sensing histidine kinase KdpD